MYAESPTQAFSPGAQRSLLSLREHVLWVCFCPQELWETLWEAIPSYAQQKQGQASVNDPLDRGLLCVA